MEITSWPHRSTVSTAEFDRMLGLPRGFVLHSMRHTFLTRLGEAGVDAFTIMRIAGHSSITVSQKYVHPSTGAMERAFKRLAALNASKEEKRSHPLQYPLNWLRSCRWW
jgi:integrase